MVPDTPNSFVTWEPIPGLEERFMVSNTGLVRTIKTGKLRKTQILPNGYELFTYYVGDWHHLKMKSLLVHRAVALAFIPNPDNKPTVNHKNGVKTDNRDTNLEWMSVKENIHHAMDTGLSLREGQNNGNSALTELQVREIRTKRAAGYSGIQLSRAYGVQPAAISKIVKRQTWAHLD